MPALTPRIDVFLYVLNPSIWRIQSGLITLGACRSNVVASMRPVKNARASSCSVNTYIRHKKQIAQKRLRSLAVARSGSIPYIGSQTLGYRRGARDMRNILTSWSLRSQNSFDARTGVNGLKRGVARRRVFTRIHEHAEQGLLVNCNSMHYLPIAPGSDCPAPN